VLDHSFGRREGPAIALAQVKEALDGLRTAVFQVTEEEMRGSPPRLVTETTRVFVTKSAWRWESADGTVGITDLKTAKEIILYPAKNKALVTQVKNSSNPFDSLLQGIATMLGRSMTDPGAAPSVTLYAQPTYLVDHLEEREVDGKRAVGLLCRGGLEETTIWADPVTKLPVRVETVHSPSPSRGIAGEQLTMHDFEFNKELEASLFSTEPPAGYEVEVQEKPPAAGGKAKAAGEGGKPTEEGKAKVKEGK
jgi:outer membrane lipoprotein-sorting protein